MLSYGFRGMKRGWWRLVSLFAVLTSISLLLSAIMNPARTSATGLHGAVTVTVATVDNPQMEDLQKLTYVFEKSHPTIKIKYVVLPENQLRQQVTQDIATHSGRYDIVTIGTYETPLWAKNGWIENLTPFATKTAGYDVSDLIPAIRRALSYHGQLYAIPFYGESSFTMYRKDLFRKAGLKMPLHPTWYQIASMAKKLNNRAHGVYGICLRGLPGWGEQLAPLDTVVNTFGGEWFDMKWQPQLTSPAFERAVSFYVNLIRQAGEPGAANDGFTECLNIYNQGKAAIWYDATSAAGDLTGRVAHETGYAYAPVVKTKYSGWLWAWAFAVPSTSRKKDAAWTFISWATSKPYIRLVGEKLGWPRVPPGTRKSTYSIPAYRKVASSFGPLTLKSIEHANVNHPTIHPVPYTGVQYVDIPEFQELGDEVSQQIAAAIAGDQSVKTALQKAQQFAQAVASHYQK